ncbi:MAG TPA: lanthionine synthetase LanC family protein [Blastocatellia bacterium]|nr:lanthionine synthetase LanC family protein [Blastocatellia bacterium]
MNILIIIVILMLTLPGIARPNDPDYMKTSLQAAKWIRSSAVNTEQGITWPADPADPKSVNLTLYSGSPGVILFFLEAYRATGDKSFLRDARRGADSLLGSIASINDYGLYTGLAGLGFTLEETFKATGEREYRQAAIRCAEIIIERAVKTGGGIEWNDTTDIIGGSAGTGLFLLYAAREFKRPEFLDSASLAARRLIELGRREGRGVKWAMNPRFPRLMPNFSHGTAGIAYFLVSVYTATKVKPFLDAAIQGAEYLLSIAKTDGDLCLIFHNEPDGKELYYLGWCHGPVGTARLFYQLYRATGEDKWMDWVHRSARAVMASGIPEKQTPGFWNNVSQCCGSAGVADFFLSLYKASRNQDYLEFSKRVAAQLISRTTIDEKGARWVQAEHRVRPEQLAAQTGYMQGASGIALLMLRLHYFERGKELSIILPDSPF